MVRVSVNSQEEREFYTTEDGTYKSVTTRFWPPSEHGAHFRVNMAHTRQSRPDSDLGFQVKSLKHFRLFPLGSEAAYRGTSLI